MCMCLKRCVRMDRKFVVCVCVCYAKVSDEMEVDTTIASDKNSPNVSMASSNSGIVNASVPDIKSKATAFIGNSFSLFTKSQTNQEEEKTLDLEGIELNLI